MKVSELWLRSLINPPLSAVQLADQLTQVGIEVDGSEKVGDQEKQTIWTLKIAPNRGDCLSMEGIAREVSLLNKMPYLAIPKSTIAASQKRILPMRIENPELCPRYLGCTVFNVNATAKIPAWLKNRLEWAGIRSVSIIVDILNYVMLELGQPFHAFDLDKLDQEIVVRNSVEGERVQLIDEQQVILKAGTLVIADKSRVQALAGVMGGGYSAVGEATQSIFVECAYFNPIAIRLASKNYGIRSESSFRFERGVDPELQKRALERAVQLIIELAGGESGALVEEKNEQFIPKVPIISLRKERIKTILGTEIPEVEVQGILQRAGMQVSDQKEAFSVTPPSFRQDIAIEVDLIEEIARVYGLDRLPSEKMSGSIEYSLNRSAEITHRAFKALFMARGYDEAITYSFMDPVISQLFRSKTNPLVIINPIAADMAMMRESLWPGLLQAVTYNQNRQCSRVRLFEMGTCFRENRGKILESKMLAGVSVGSLLREQWGEPARSPDFYDLKSDIEALLALVGAQDLRFVNTDHPVLHPGQSAEIFLGNCPIGYLGVLHPQIQKTLGLEGAAIVFELNLQYLQNTELPVCSILSKFPAIRRDIAILVNDQVPADELKTAIIQTAGDYLEDLLIFDVYKGRGIELGQKSVAVGLILRHPSRTLVEREVHDIVQGVLSMLKKQFQAILRE